MAKVKTIEERELELIEQGTDASREQAEALGKDAELLSALRQLDNAATLLDDGAGDVEARLANFHKSHSNHHSDKEPAPSTSNISEVQKSGIPFSTARRIWYGAALLAVAAAIAALFVFTNITKAPDLEKSPIAYSSVANLKGVTIVGKSGKPIVEGTNKPSESFNVLDAKASDVVLTAAVPSGNSYEVTLADGTRVYMHANSRLVFPTEFKGDKREVRLDGEAYFVVSHDAQHPFIVHSDNIETEVTGTEFYLRAYSGNRSNVTLINGRVIVKGNGDEVVMAPGQQVSTNAGGLKVRNVDLRPYTYWRDGYLFYDHVSLKKIIEDIASDYNYTVSFDTEAPLDNELHFVAERTHGITDVLATLADVTGLNLSISGSTIIVK